ncbi:glycosyltransferase family protein [Nitrosopumilus sp.]|nr:glycosyltransferase family protein [Nitrosopumilus sp.]
MIGCIIQARVGSTRLPKKVLLPINQFETVLSFGIKQIQQSNLIDRIVIATTDLQKDDELVEHIKKLNISLFRGNSTDVLDRYYQCAKKFSFSTIIRITSDCPLTDPTIVDEIISNFINNKNSFDYASNVHPQRTFPHGSDIEIFTFKALQTAWKEAKKSSEREHVTPYIYNNQKFKLFNHTSKNDLSNFRWTVDYLEDLELVRQIISRIQARPILIKDIITLMSENPKLKKINQIHSKK